MLFATDLVGKTMAFPLEIGNIPHQLIFLGVAVSAVKADKPPGADAVGPIVDVALTFLYHLSACLLTAFLLYLFHLSFKDSSHAQTNLAYFSTQGNYLLLADLTKKK